MSGQLLIDTIPFQYQILEEGDSSKRMRVRGKFQQEGVKNENGRIYPRGLFSRKLSEKKIRDKIESRGMFGELDHPCITTDDFKVLTVAKGWKHFRDIEVGDLVWSRVKGEAVISVVNGIIDQPYRGTVFNVNGPGINTTFTPAHKFVLDNRSQQSDKKETLIQLADIAANQDSFIQYAIPRAAEFHSSDIDEIVINHTTFPVDEFSALMGIYLSSGHCSSSNKTVLINQQQSATREIIKNGVLSKLSGIIEWQENGDGFIIHSEDLHSYLKPLGDIYSRYVPFEVKSLSDKHLKSVIFWYSICSDSIGTHLHSGGSFGSSDFGSANCLFALSPQLISDLHECLVRSGLTGTLAPTYPRESCTFAGVTVGESYLCYCLYIDSSPYIWLDPRYVVIDEQYYEGNIYCLSVTHGNFYMEHGGNSFWTGNSDGKTALSRVSHIVTDVYVDRDGTVIGEAEILDTPAGKILQEILKSGGRVGTSSRGRGSLGKDNVVQDDYVLETWDFVANPSTYGAFPEVISEGVEVSNLDEAVDKLEEIKDYLKHLEHIRSVGDIKSLQTDHLIEHSLKLTEYENTIRNIERMDEVDSDDRIYTVTSFLLEEIQRLQDLIDPNIPYRDLEGGNAMSDSQSRSIDEQQVSDNLEIIQEQIASLAEDNDTLGELQNKYSAAIAIIEEMKNRYNEEQEMREEVEERLEAAELLINNLIEKIKRGNAEVSEGLNEALDDSESVLQEQAEYIEAIEDLLEDTQARYDASVSLLEAVLVRGKESRVESFIEEALEGDPQADAIRPLLENCQSPEEVEETLALIESVRGDQGAAYDSGLEYEPLPESNNQYLLEDIEDDSLSFDEDYEDQSWLMEDVNDAGGVQLTNKVLKKLGW